VRDTRELLENELSDIPEQLDVAELLIPQREYPLSKPKDEESGDV
jgi:hypothetical protein